MAIGSVFGHHDDEGAHAQCQSQRGTLRRSGTRDLSPIYAE